jgi:hypothetical protein
VEWIVNIIEIDAPLGDVKVMKWNNWVHEKHGTSLQGVHFNHNPLRGFVPNIEVV